MNNNRKIALTEQEVEELMNGESIFINLEVGGSTYSVELYKGEEEDNETN